MKYVPKLAVRNQRSRCREQCDPNFFLEVNKMSFRFGFARAGDGGAGQPGVVAFKNEGHEEEEVEEEEEEDDYPYMPATEVPRQPLRSSLEGARVLHLNRSEGALTLLLGKVDSKEAADLLKDERVLASDLVPGVNEGGFKLWVSSLVAAAHSARP